MSTSSPGSRAAPVSTSPRPRAAGRRLEARSCPHAASRVSAPLGGRRRAARGPHHPRHYRWPGPTDALFARRGSPSPNRRRSDLPARRHFLPHSREFPGLAGRYHPPVRPAADGRQGLRRHSPRPRRTR
jgi:hypothetical protein